MITKKFSDCLFLLAVIFVLHKHDVTLFCFVPCIPQMGLFMFDSAKGRNQRIAISIQFACKNHIIAIPMEHLWKIIWSRYFSSALSKGDSWRFLNLSCGRRVLLVGFPQCCRNFLLPRIHICNIWIHKSTIFQLISIWIL